MIKNCSILAVCIITMRRLTGTTFIALFVLSFAASANAGLLHAYARSAIDEGGTASIRWYLHGGYLWDYSYYTFRSGRATYSGTNTTQMFDAQDNTYYYGTDFTEQFDDDGEYDRYVRVWGLYYSHYVNHGMRDWDRSWCDLLPIS
jgi:hypothetical protein